MKFDVEKVIDAGFAAVRGYVDRGFGLVGKRLDALEKRQPERGENGADGKDGVQGEQGPEGVGVADAAILREGDLLLTFTDGRTKSLGFVVGKDGIDGKPGADGERGPEGPAGRDGADGKDGAPGRDGQSVTAEDVLPVLKERVADFLSAIPPPENGKDGAAGRDGKDGERGAAGADGRSAVKFLVDQAGELVGTFSDGTIEKLGVVKGKDGASGRDGRDGVDGAPGANGVDGADGFGFDDLEFEHDGARGFSFKFIRGDKVKTFNFAVPAMIYRGVYAASGEYERGDVVTFGGSTWHCNDNTADKPDGMSKAWTLVVKKGRDGKDGLAGEKGERGLEGRPGRDLTQLGVDGSKW